MAKEIMTDILCSESLDISMAANLHEALKKALDSGTPVNLQARRVERADTAALQLLVAFIRAARSRGVAVSWNEPSAALCRCAALLGLAQALEMPSQG